MILLHGGNGFLGSHIAQVAIDRGIEVAVVGRREHPNPRLPKEVLYSQVGSSSFEDILSRTNTIVYLAHSSRPSRTADGLTHELSTNVQSISDFINELSARGFPGQLFYASSGGQVYGKGANRPALESDPLNPNTNYGMGKLLCEEIVHYGRRVNGLNATILRIANPVGYGQIGSGHGLIGAIFRALRDNVPLSLFGTGQNVRDYFSADDLGVLIADLHKKGWRGDGTFNIGSGIGHTELDILGMIVSVLGKTPEIIFKDARPFDLPYAVINPDKAIKQLGWNASQSLTDIINLMAQKSLNYSPNDYSVEVAST